MTEQHCLHRRVFWEIKCGHSHPALGVPQVLQDSRTVLLAADVLPDGPFPQDEKLKDGMRS